jgi:hypothetical protein
VLPVHPALLSHRQSDDWLQINNKEKNNLLEESASKSVERLTTGGSIVGEARPAERAQVHTSGGDVAKADGEAVSEVDVGAEFQDWNEGSCTTIELLGAIDLGLCGTEAWFTGSGDCEDSGDLKSDENESKDHC